MKIKLSYLVEDVLKTVIAKQSLQEKVNKEFMQYMFYNPRVRMSNISNSLGLQSYTDKLEGEINSAMQMVQTGDEKTADFHVVETMAKLFFLEKGLAEFTKKLFGYKLELDAETTIKQFSPALQAKLGQLFMAFVPKNLEQYKNNFMQEFMSTNNDVNEEDELKVENQDLLKINYGNISKEIIGLIAGAAKRLASIKSPDTLVKLISKMIAQDTLADQIRGVDSGSTPDGKSNNNWKNVIYQLVYRANPQLQNQQRPKAPPRQPEPNNSPASVAQTAPRTPVAIQNQPKQSQ